jgi:hypothetical protein
MTVVITVQCLPRLPLSGVQPPKEFGPSINVRRADSERLPSAFWRRGNFLLGHQLLPRFRIGVVSAPVRPSNAAAMVAPMVFVARRTGSASKCAYFCVVSTDR